MLNKGDILAFVLSLPATLPVLICGEWLCGVIVSAIVYTLVKILFWMHRLRIATFMTAFGIDRKDISSEEYRQHSEHLLQQVLRGKIELKSFFER